MELITNAQINADISSLVEKFERLENEDPERWIVLSQDLYTIIDLNLHDLVNLLQTFTELAHTE